ncbi:unnamed protein product [Dibothriocephalus latus]|uniref:Ig-like domain-containing protein n=1 Tax=Dibothriocephalus latus TaxID=60516 RepID=A0A3P6S574_DIBLA|nr:unnamed protein product [Dibothriocephalus latus]
MKKGDKIKDESANFKQIHGPVLQGPPHEIEAVSIGESIRLVCIVDANPTAAVTWYRYTGIRLVNQHTFNQLSDNASGYGIFSPLILTPSFLHIRIEQEDSLTGATSFIKFVHLKEAHFGVYNCTVTTDLGTDVRTIHLIRADEIPYAFAIGVSVTSVVAVTFAVAIFLVLRRSSLRSGKSSRIITANSANQPQTG